LVETVEIDDSTRQAVKDDVEEWDSNIEGLELSPSLTLTFKSQNRNREYRFKNSIDDHLAVIPTAACTQFRFTDRRRQR